MYVKINPELWNTLTPVQKRALAESVDAAPARTVVDFAEVIAWATTLAATMAVVCGVTFILH
jgi:hypothetical protein